MSKNFLIFISILFFISLYFVIYSNLETKKFSNKSQVFYEKINNVNVRLYFPNDTNNDNPIMIYFVGGGYAYGKIESFDPFLKEFVKNLNMVVVSVQYRLAPKNPFPDPIDDCYSVTKYVIDNIAQFGANINKLVIAGDSAGGKAVAVTIKRLIKDNYQAPKIQVLIYPWLQMFDFKLPSYQKYSSTLQMAKFTLWYLGLETFTDKEKNILLSNFHFELFDKDTKKTISSYLNPDLIPKMYKNDKDYYVGYIKNQTSNSTSILHLHTLKKNKFLMNKLKLLTEPLLSPLFADSEIICKTPKTYVIIVEIDPLKDEGILYAERLKQFNIPVDVAYYEDTRHGIAGYIENKQAQKILSDLINYINKAI